MTAPNFNSAYSWGAGMQVLRAARVHAPSIVFQSARFHIFSRTEWISSGETIEAALTNGGFLPAPVDRIPTPFVANGVNVVKFNEHLGENEQVAKARSGNMAVRIANALNEYVPGDKNR